MAKHGWHWPREEQVANAFEDAFDLSGDDAAAARVKAAWAPLLPPFESPIDPARPEFGNVPELDLKVPPYTRHGGVIGDGRRQEG